MTTPVALVTGTSRGIGLAIAGALIDAGYRVHGAARTLPADAPVGLESHACDVGDVIDVRALIQAIGGTEGRLDLLVNNAGLSGTNSLDPDGDDSLWNEILQTNLNGTYYCCKAALPLMPDGSGRIVNIASVLGLRGVADQTAYCAAKHGVVGFTRALAHAVGPRGITVNAVCPGWIDTEMAQSRFAALDMTAEQAGAETPLGRIGMPADVAGIVLFLASAAAAHITGQTITVDGGALA